MVVWLLGVSGAGKTTLGNELKRYFDMQGHTSYIIDGDLIRNFFDNDLGYTKQERIHNIKRVILCAFVLEQNGVTPIVCNISPFEFLREFARAKFDNYIEIYLQRALDDIHNKEFVYSSKENVIGKDIEFEIPKQPDITLDTTHMSVQQSLEHIIEYLENT